MAMKKRHSALALAVIPVMVLLLQAGCTGRSKASRFYILRPVAAESAVQKNDSANTDDLTIGIAPVTLPKYLRKPQIVTWAGDNELYLAEFDRWAGNIEEDIGRVIAENLSRILVNDKVVPFPAMDSLNLDYTVKIEIITFAGRLGGDSELTARWAVFDDQGGIASEIRTMQSREATQGVDYSALVAAHSRNLAILSQELAAVLQELAAR